ncbi:hypothetical protein L9F63_005124, partial [Diploptera punctata]
VFPNVLKCSLVRVSKFLFVFPMYTLLQMITRPEICFFKEFSHFTKIVNIFPIGMLGNKDMTSKETNLSLPSNDTLFSSFTNSIEFPILLLSKLVFQ